MNLKLYGSRLRILKIKIFFCCCAYRHPNADVKKFNDHIDQIMQKISKENKLLFLMGDFNVNLLNYESHIDTNDFIKHNDFSLFIT